MSSYLLYTEFLNTTWWELSPVYAWSSVVGFCWHEQDCHLEKLLAQGCDDI